ncbi:peptidase M15 [Bacillus sp. M6-12]|uniref:M15 family metallopeptidase n=1 Tax=Bacillus sp. M6-12 TaxID=2054166 RepID=UPI000C75C5DD|nr:M15 family metallopeptidase [Bacillus sp. M6-12]PLS17196.1 peptidase M15 [Bacillus sp. M6-12]
MKKVILLAVSFILLLPAMNAKAVAYTTSKEKSNLVDIRKLDKTIVIDLRYATNNNFAKKQIYPLAIPLLRKETAQKLVMANRELSKKGYRIKIWDAYRPFSAQQVLWNAAAPSQKRFVANPLKGSNHNRGASVDITLADKNGKELKMPTGFDNFTAAAAPAYKKMDPTARKNLNILAAAMKKQGFTTISNEWWHFDDSNRKKYPILNVPLDQFK